MHAYWLSKLLRQFGVADSGRHERLSVAVLSLASDPTALALGPQLAAFASARGIPTALVVGPQQDMNVTATLQYRMRGRGAGDLGAREAAAAPGHGGRPGQARFVRPSRWSWR